MAGSGSYTELLQKRRDLEASEKETEQVNVYILTNVSILNYAVHTCITFL